MVSLYPSHRSGRFSEAVNALRTCTEIAKKRVGGIKTGICFEKLARVLNRQGRVDEALVVGDCSMRGWVAVLINLWAQS